MERKRSTINIKRRKSLRSLANTAFRKEQKSVKERKQVAAN